MIGQDLPLYEIVEILTVNLEPSDHRLMTKIYYYEKLCEFATSANPGPNMSRLQLDYEPLFLGKM